MARVPASARSCLVRRCCAYCAKCIDAARSKSGRNDEATALEAWRALVSGTWSLVDVFEKDGRRLLIARENEPGAPAAEPLTLRERQVVVYAALGHSQKLIAYTVGLSVSSVSAQLTRACRKLGVATPMQLATALGWGSAVGASPSNAEPAEAGLQIRGSS